MAIDITMPKLGLTMTEGRLVEWLVPAGEQVRKGQPIAVIETEKVTAEMEAEADGVLEHLTAAGETVEVETVIGHLLQPEEAG